MYTYYFYNIKVKSDIILPGLEDIKYKPEINKEIFIRGYHLSNFNSYVSEENRRIRDNTEIFFENDYLVMKYKKQWEMSILKNGNGIYIKEECGDLGQAISVLLGTGLSILLLFSSYIPIHAGAFEYQKRAVTVVGKSGVGKSSFIRYAIEQGYKMVTEDTLPVTLYKEELEAFPSISIKSKLNEQMIKHFEIPKQFVGDQIKKTKKYWVSVSQDNRYYFPIALERIYFLSPGKEYSEIQIKVLGIEEKKKKIFSVINSINDLPIVDTKIVIKKIYKMLRYLDAYIIYYPIGMEQFPKLLKGIIDNENSKNSIKTVEEPIG